LSATSTPISITTNSFLNCYCSSQAQYQYDQEITNFTFNGVSTHPSYANLSGCFNSAPGTGSIQSRYSNFKSLGSHTSVLEGNPVTYNIQVEDCDGAPYYAFGAGIWIDLNHNGSFNDAGEAMMVEPNATVGPRNITGSFVIPFGSATGETAMRVIVAESYAGSNLIPCLNYDYGETEDYIITIISNTPCSGTPNPGNTIATPSSVCLGGIVTLSLQNFTSGSGITYQWYNNLGAIVGATNSTAIISNITSIDDYYCDVTCGGSSVSSNLVSVTLNNFLNCYCFPNSSFGTSGGFYGSISHVSISNLDNTSFFPFNSPFYTDYPSSITTTALTQGLTYPLQVTVGSYTQAGVWIDWNQSGNYDVNEFTYLGVNPTSNNNVVLNQLISVPNNAIGGITKMRIRSEVDFYTLGSANACTATTYGESEDYTISVTIATPCNGVPQPGNTLASALSACQGTTVVLSLQDQNLGAGISYQWYNGSGIIAGATSSYYTPIISVSDNFYCAVTCLNSNSTTNSNPVTIALNSPMTCYCLPIYLNGKVDGDLISDVIIGGTTLANNTGSAQVNPAYTYYQTSLTGLPINLTAILQAGSSYNVSITFGAYTGGGQNAAAWIDYNDDGVFDLSERIGYTSAPSTGAFDVANFPISLNCAPPLGIHRLRIRDVYGVSGINIDPCAIYTYGETEDYDITISASVPCPQPTGLNALMITTNSADLTWTSGCIETMWDVHVTTAGGGAPTSSPSHPNVSNPVTISGLTPSTNYEYWVRANCGGVAGSSAWSGPYLFSTLVASNSVLHLTCFIESYWDGTSAMLPTLANQFEPTTTGACDSIDVNLHDATSPYGVLYTSRAVLQQDGNASVTFPSLSGAYFISVTHRNALTTWSAAPVLFGAVTNYDFTISASQAYGGNQVEIANGVFAFYAGDVEKDASESTDLLDIAPIETDITNFGYGYLATDLNGDGNVDILDTTQLENNIANFIFTQRP